MIMTAVLLTLISALLAYLSYNSRYWELRGVSQMRSLLPLGNVSKLKSMHLCELLHEVYATFHGRVPVAGSYIFTKPIAVVLDLDIVKAILIKDFNKFVDRIEYRNEEREPLSGHLFFLHGEKWRSLRQKLTPTFTSGKMKFMFPTIVAVAHELESVFTALVAQSPKGVVEIRDILARFTTDVIGTCAFGLECNSLKDPQAEFRSFGRTILKSDLVLWTLFKQTYGNVFKQFGVKRIRDATNDFVMRVVRETVTRRERENIQRNDFINLLIELKNTKDAANGAPILSMEQLAAQVFVFFIAGFETSSSNMTFGLYELAKNPDVQERVRHEICTVLERHAGVLTYEAMMEMTYLDQMISETLRKYPALGALTRIATEDYTIPDTDITLAKGTKVYIPVREIHYDPDIYEDPYTFRPERFSADEVQQRHPLAFLGFGEGPRNCIGLRFGRMQARIGLITLLRSFRFRQLEGAPDNVEISSHSMIMMPKDGVYLMAEKL